MEEQLLLLQRAITTLDNMRDVQAQLRAFVEQHPNESVGEAMKNLESSIIVFEGKVADLKALVGKSLN